MDGTGIEDDRAERRAAVVDVLAQGVLDLLLGKGAGGPRRQKPQAQQRWTTRQDAGEEVGHVDR